ncbi:MAG: RluA family pseudouridine synthase [Oscillospiraceae bacterium]
MGRTRQGVQQKRNKDKPNTEFIVEQEIGLLEFLLIKLTKQSRNNVKSLLSHREILVNGKVITKYDYVLKEGQKVEVNWSLARDNGKKSLLDIIYEDSEIIVINKPAGLLSIATNKEDIRTAYHMLMEYVRIDNPKNRIFVVHRLDRDTSGIMVAAKNEKIKLLLQENWADIILKRGYVALVEGKLESPKGTVRSWLRETQTHFMYSSATEGDGQEAITDYEVVSENEEYSLVDVRLQTGRKNQIRVHMKDMGHSIAGDKKYGGQTNPLGRLCLHAYILEVKHPVTRKIMCFETEIPRKFISLSRQ